jgi:hypothetical protein
MGVGAPPGWSGLPPLTRTRSGTRRARPRFAALSSLGSRDLPPMRSRADPLKKYIPGIRNLDRGRSIRASSVHVRPDPGGRPAFASTSPSEQPEWCPVPPGPCRPAVFSRVQRTRAVLSGGRRQTRRSPTGAVSADAQQRPAGRPVRHLIGPRFYEDEKKGWPPLRVGPGSPGGATSDRPHRGLGPLPGPTLTILDKACRAWTSSGPFRFDRPARRAQKTLTDDRE